MKSASLLVYAPGIPFSPEHLIPQRDLAAAAAALLLAGHQTQTVDFGTLDTLQRMATPALRAQARRLVECAGEMSLWETLRDARTRQERVRLRPLLDQARQRRDACLMALAEGGQRLDFVAFFARTGEDAAEVLDVAARLRASRPALRLVLFGPYAEQYGAIFMSSTRHFDAAVTGEPEITLAAWAGAFADPDRWKGIPGLLFRRGGEVLRTPSDYTADLAALPPACYGASAYPASATSGKVHLYTLEMSRGLPRPGYGMPDGPLPGLAVRGKPPAALHDEIMALHRNAGARAFHLCGRGASAGTQDALAVLLSAHPLGILYSRSAGVARFETARLPVLAASGCCAVDFQVDTGSQRLIEDFYGHDFSVTPMEAVLRACRAAGIYTAVHLTFPCPQDDAHTQAETLRILRRCRPDAATVRAPRLLPGSPWCVRAGEFGFRIPHQGYARWARTMLGDRFPLSASGSIRWSGADLELAYRMAGWPHERAAHARRLLLEEIQRIDIALAGSAQLGLMARLAGRAGSEGEFIDAFARALFTFDVETASSMAACINENAMRPKNTYVLHPFRPLLAAVAN